MTGVPDADGRRRRTLDRLDAEGIPYHPGLMRLPSEEEAAFPAAEAITLRALALVLVACEATGVSNSTVDGLIDLYTPPFSPAEWRWFEDPARDPGQTRDFGWRFESALPLLWSVGLAAAMKRPDSQTEPFEILEPLVRFRRDELLARAALRPAGEILDSADLHFCYQCASLLALDEGAEPPAGLDSLVLLERHRAFTWLIQSGGDWDEVTARA
ncbi:MAG TPA: DUF4272 domain-containing protein [Allosphingosinicella sp.]|jgi:hypothetical protein